MTIGQGILRALVWSYANKTKQSRDSCIATDKRLYSLCTAQFITMFVSVKSRRKFISSSLQQWQNFSRKNDTKTMSAVHFSQPAFLNHKLRSFKLPLDYQRRQCMLMLYIIYVYCSTQLTSEGREKWQEYGFAENKSLEELNSAGGKYDSTLEKSALFSKVRKCFHLYCAILQENQNKEKDSRRYKGYHPQHYSQCFCCKLEMCFLKIIILQ